MPRLLVLALVGLLVGGVLAALKRRRAARQQREAERFEAPEAAMARVGPPPDAPPEPETPPPAA